MKLIILYGPPAVGKLTVAKKLSELTSYRILDNHITVDLISRFFNFDSSVFHTMSKDFRLRLLEEAAKAKLNGVIYTTCHTGGGKGLDWKPILELRKKYGVQIYFVQLVAEKEVLEKRVVAKSRKNFLKIKTKKHLRKSLGEADFFAKVPRVKTFTINNSKLTAKKVAETIVNHYKLKKTK